MIFGHRTSPAEKSPAQNGSVQLVVACVAAHWFNLPEFFVDTDRVLCSNGVVALTSYFLPIVVSPHEQAEDLNQALRHVGPILNFKISQLSMLF